MPGMFLIQNNGSLVEMTEASYDSEDLLQQLLAKYPSLLAGDQMESSNPRRWLLIRREMPVPSQEDGGARWSLDHLFLDQDAIPTLIEVKRSSDTRIRREVVGQMLDYAANAVVYWPVEEFRSQFNRECEACGVDPDGHLRAFLGDESSPDEFWQHAKTNLQAGRIRMVFVADVIPRELRRIVEFLNAQMEFAEVLAVEIKQYLGGDGLRTLVPRVIGQTAEAEKKKGSPKEGRVWDDESFYAEFSKRHAPEVLSACRRLDELLAQNATRREFGRGRIDGNIFPLHDDERGRQLVFNLSTNGFVGVSFGGLKAPPFSDYAKRKELLSRLNDVPGVVLPEDSLEGFPRFDLRSVVTNAGFEKLVKVVEWAIRQIIESRTTTK